MKQYHYLSIAQLLALFIPKLAFCTLQYSIRISVRHFLGEQLSHAKFYKNLVDCVLSHTILKIQSEMKFQGFQTEQLAILALFF